VKVATVCLVCLLLFVAGCGPDKVEKAIADLTHQSDSVRVEAARSLRTIGDQRAIEPLIAALKDRNQRVRDSAKAALLVIADETNVDTFITGLKDPLSFVRETAASVLAEIGDDRAVEPLIAALGDIPQAAALALGDIGDQRAVDPLIDLLSRSDTAIQHTIAWALGELDDPRAAEPLVATLGGHHKWYRQRVAEVLDKLGSKAIIALFAALESGDEDLVEDVVWVLGKMKSLESAVYLTNAIVKEELGLVAQLYTVYIQKGVPNSEDVLIEVLSEHGDVRMATDFLNCGNVKLREAAMQWGKDRGLKVEYRSPMGTELRWGGK